MWVPLSSIKSSLSQCGLLGWLTAEHPSPYIHLGTPEGDLSHVMGLSGAEAHCLILNFSQSSARRHT